MSEGKGFSVRLQKGHQSARCASGRKRTTYTLAELGSLFKRKGAVILCRGLPTHEECITVPTVVFSGQNMNNRIKKAQRLLHGAGGLGGNNLLIYNRGEHVEGLGVLTSLGFKTLPGLTFPCTCTVSVTVRVRGTVPRYHFRKWKSLNTGGTGILYSTRCTHLQVPYRGTSILQCTSTSLWKTTSAQTAARNDSQAQPKRPFSLKK